MVDMSYDNFSAYCSALVVLIFVLLSYIMFNQAQPTHGHHAAPHLMVGVALACVLREGPSPPCQPSPTKPHSSSMAPGEPL